MSRKIKERTKELALQEKRLKSQLIGGSNSLKSKANRVGKLALIGGVATLGIYAIYRIFFQDEPPKKKKKVSSSNLSEKIIVFLLPYVGKLFERIFSEMSKKEESKEADKKAD